MNYQLKTKRGSCRLGSLHIGKVSFETPMCSMYTRSGTMPHIAIYNDFLEQNYKITLQLTLPTLVDQPSIELVKKLDGGIQSFIGTKISSILTIQDPAVEPPSGYNIEKAVSVWTPGGRRQIGVSQFLSIIESFRPNIVECLCDTIPSTGQTAKRIKKSVDRTLKYLEEIVKHKENNKESQYCLLGAVEGSDSINERLRSANETAKHPVDGFVLEGFSNHKGDWPTLLVKTTAALPDEKPRFIQSINSPEDIIKAVECGIDVFDSSYPYQVTERGCALIFPPCIKKIKTNNVTATEQNNDIDWPVSNHVTCSEYEIDLNDSRYSQDMNSLSMGRCGCYCCVNHSRAYVHHLLVTKEMLAQVLLMMHNLNQYYRFFQDLRRALEDDKWDEFKERFNVGKS